MFVFFLCSDHIKICSGNNASFVKFNFITRNLYVAESFNKEIVNLISGKFVFIWISIDNRILEMLKIKVIIHRVILAARNQYQTIFMYPFIYCYIQQYRYIDSALKSDTIFYACPHKNNQPGRILSTRFHAYFTYVSLSWNETKEINFAR